METQQLALIVVALIVVFIVLYRSATAEPAKNDPGLERITSTVFLDVSVCVKKEKKFVGKILIGLFGETVPKTAENFRCLCLGNKTLDKRKLHFKGTIFHRIIPGFMCQGGDFTHGNGMGGLSIYGPKFADENFKLKHVAPYYLSMANSGPNTNGSQFFITTKTTSWLDGKHVVFGKVIDGQDVVKSIEDYGQRSGQPLAKIEITDCGEIVPQK